MGKPRLIIIVRHAQSVGNANRTIHQTVPDHRVPLTEVGHQQALEAGDKLAALLLPTDTLQIITSPYTRTRETTQGILSSSLQKHPNANSIKVYEEPRLREQDFGNFQPCQAEMTRMWHERAAYGHFFYRIPNGESAADAYDRVSGFNESLWRQFAEQDFPSVLVLVTHGLMTRIFLMKWYHYSVEYFEDLRNIDHCEFVIMERSPATDKYDLKTPLRTWSAGDGTSRVLEEENRYRCPPLITTTAATPKIPLKSSAWGDFQFGGCVHGCDHGKLNGSLGLGVLSLGTGGLVTSAEPSVMQAGRDFGGSRSGAASHDGSGDEDDETSNKSNKSTSAAGVKNAEGKDEGDTPVDTWERLKKEQIEEMKSKDDVLGDVAGVESCCGRSRA